MGQLLVRNLDDAIIERLKQKARREQTSLEQTLRNILTKAVTTDRRDLLGEIEALRGRLGPSATDSTDLIREDRDNAEPHR
jgi:plasmid stability protein